MKILFIAYLILFSTFALGQSVVGDMLSKPTMSKFEAEVISNASKASSPEIAYDILSKSSSKDWAGASLLFNLGNVCYQLEKYSEAIKFYNRALEKKKFFLAYKNLALAYAAVADEKNAYETFLKVLAISGNSDIQSLLWLADYNAERRDFSTALTMCNQALIYRPNDKNIAYAKCKFLYESGRLSEAEIFAKQKYELTSDSKFLRICIRASLDNGNRQASVSYLELLRFTKEANEQDCRLLGDLYFAMSAYSKALEVYAQNNAKERLENLAMASLNLGDLDTAQNVLPKIKTSDKYYKIAGFIASAKGDNKSASVLLEKFAKTNPDDFSTVCELAEVLYEQKEYARSALMFSRLLPDDSYAKVARYGMLRNALAMQNYIEALHMAKEISTLYPDTEIKKFELKLEAYCNELEKSTR